MPERHVVIVGCGRVGAALAGRLVEEGSTVAVVDREPSAFKRLGELTVETVVGVGYDRSVLEEAGVARAAAVAAVTNGDNSNIVIARVARERYEVGVVVARIYDPQRAAIYERLGISTIATVRWTTDRLLQKILGSEDEVWVDPTARVAVVERMVPLAWVGSAVAAVEASQACRVVALTRLGAACLPAPEQLLQEGDVLHLAVTAGQGADAVAEPDGEVR